MKPIIVIAALVFLNSAHASLGKVQFEAVGRPSMIKIKGEGAGVSSNLQINQNKIQGQISFNLETLKTGIGLRDEHMKEKYLEIKQNPLAVLTLTDVQLPLGWSLQKPNINSSVFKGKLLLHGTEHEVNGHFNVDSPQIKGEAQFEIKLSDFNISIPEYLGIKVVDLVKINVQFDQLKIVSKN